MHSTDAQNGLKYTLPSVKQKAAKTNTNNAHKLVRMQHAKGETKSLRAVDPHIHAFNIFTCTRKRAGLAL